jgi:hypothetical protein
MDKQQDSQQPKKLSLKRETVRLLSGPEAVKGELQPLTTPKCTDAGPRCEF